MRDKAARLLMAMQGNLQMQAGAKQEVRFARILCIEKRAR